MVSCETINRNGQPNYDDERKTFEEMNTTLSLDYLNSLLAEPIYDKNPNRKHKLWCIVSIKWERTQNNTILSEQFQNLIEKRRKRKDRYS